MTGSTAPGLDVDLSTSKPFADGLPFDAFEQMRDHEPVKWNESGAGSGH